MAELPIMQRTAIVFLLVFSIFACSLGYAQSAHYRHQKAVLLNDLRVTPGAARADGVTEVCNTVTSTVRRVTPRMKKQVCASYGIPLSRCNGQNFEIDHLIPLELGGSNELSNLWPQPYRPRPGAREKDVFEDFLHRQVCSGQMDIRAARQAIVQDWFRAWKQMVISPH